MSHRRLLFATLAVVCLVASGCGNSVQEKIIGTWTLDLEATKGLAHFQAMPEKQRATLYKNLDGMAMEVEFSATTLTKTSSAVVVEGLDRMKEIVTGTYRVNRSRGNTLVLAVQTSDGMRRVGIEIKGDHQMVFDMDESKTVLKRK